MSKEPRKKIKVEPLQLNKETLAGLSDQEAENVKGGVAVGTIGCQVQPGRSGECSGNICPTLQGCV